VIAEDYHQLGQGELTAGFDLAAQELADFSLLMLLRIHLGLHRVSLSERFGFSTKESEESGTATTTPEFGSRLMVVEALVSRTHEWRLRLRSGLLLS
jgi:hypothetical protein